MRVRGEKGSGVNSIHFYDLSLQIHKNDLGKRTQVDFKIGIEKESRVASLVNGKTRSVKCYTIAHLNRHKHYDMES